MKQTGRNRLRKLVAQVLDYQEVYLKDPHGYGVYTVYRSQKSGIPFVKFNGRNTRTILHAYNGESLPKSSKYAEQRAMILISTILAGVKLKNITCGMATGKTSGYGHSQLID